MPPHTRVAIKLAHAFKIFGSIHFDRLVPRRHGANPIAMFECAQLFERLGLFERRLGERREREQEVASKSVETDVFVNGPAEAGLSGFRT